MPVPTEAELAAYAKEIAVKSIAPVAKAKAKVAKLAQAKVVKVKAPKQVAAASQDARETSRLQKIIDESPAYDEDIEDFNAILRENGISV